jgi:methylthioribose-1-phosphate isomerase
MRTVFWEGHSLNLIDQRKLPASLEIVSLHTCVEAATAIKNMTVRGAPAIGVTAAFGLALAAFEIKTQTKAEFLSELKKASSVLVAARPTAINLVWAVNRIFDVLEETEGSIGNLQNIVLREAQKIADEDVNTNHQMSLYGATLIDDGDSIIHHCNTGSLAVVDWGTALGAIRMAHEQGKHIRVLVDETRPRLQGARLTAWELQQYGIPYEIITDNMAGYFLYSGQVSKVFFGADRIAANGDIANKIGTYMLALSAYENHVPVYSVAPVSSVDFSTPEGKFIPIEERDPEEVLGLQFHGERIAPEEARARNPAFDVTPNRYITAIVTENGIVTPPFKKKLATIKNSKL